jgi:hypothetical protein
VVSVVQQENTEMVLDGNSAPRYHFGMGLLANRRKASGLSQAALAKLAKTSQPQIKRLENDERELTKSWAIKLAPHLKNTTPEELVFGDRTVQIVGYVGAGSEAHHYGNSQGGLGSARMPPGGNERTVAVEIRGDSLGAPFDGWLIYYDDRREPPTDDLIGQLCVVGLSSGQVLVKKLMRGRSPGHFDLWSTSGSPLMEQSVEWAARVQAVMPPSFAKVEAVDELPQDEPSPTRKKRPPAKQKRR